MSEGAGMECSFRSRAAKGGAKISVYRGDAGLYTYRFNNAYITVDGVSYKDKATLSVPAGTVITLVGGACGKAVDPGLVEMYEDDVLIYSKEVSGESSYGFDYTVGGDIKVKLTVSGSSTNFDSTIRITRL